MTNDELIRELRKCRNADLGDGMDALGLVNVGTMNQDMRPLRPGIEFKGFAYTVKLLPKYDGVKVCKTLDDWRRELGRGCNDIYRFANGITPETAKDMVVVIDMDGIAGGVWGSEIGLRMKTMGISGAVIDGGCRDSYETNLEDCEVFCTKRTFNHAYGRVTFGGTGMPVSCAGVTVCAGDIVCADDDGVLVIPRDRAEEVLMFARMQLEDDEVTRAKNYKNAGLEGDETLSRSKV